MHTHPHVGRLHPQHTQKNKATETAPTHIKLGEKGLTPKANKYYIQQFGTKIHKLTTKIATRQ